MELKKLLNADEYDWAVFAPCRDDFPAVQMKGKKVVVAGGHNHFARCVVYTLFAANDLHSLHMQIILLGKDSSALTGYFPQLLKRGDFQFFTFDQLAAQEKPVQADFFVYTGCCNKKLEHTPGFFFEEVEGSKTVMELAGQMHPKRFILLSDYRSCGIVERGVLCSEYENGRSDFSKGSSFDFELVKTVEALCGVYAKQHGFSYVILRTGILLGAGTGLDDTIFTDLFKAAAKGETYTLINSKNQYSFVYISDVFHALYHAMADLRVNTVYHVTGKDATVSTGMLCAMLHDLYPEQVQVNLLYSRKDPSYGTAMNDQKIRSCGCKPAITLQDAIQLMVESNRIPAKTFVFKDSYQGKIQVIQNILLSYLLEIDRICRKYKIRYFLAGGTLLGAVRHHGFIPWDDDADVMMLRDDYEKFLSVVQSELPGNVTLHTADTDPLNHCVFTKLRIDNTLFATKYTSKFPQMHNGVFFDVLCHDKTAHSKIGRKIHLQLTLLTRSLVFNKWHHRKINNGHKIQSAVANCIKAVIPLSLAQKLQFKCLRWFEKKDTGYLYDGMGRNVYNGDFPAAWLKDTVYWDFEGHRFPIPKEYDKYLLYLYGNYNDMVIASGRKNSHSIVIMDLGEYANCARPQRELLLPEEGRDSSAAVQTPQAEQQAKGEDSHPVFKTDAAPLQEEEQRIPALSQQLLREVEENLQAIADEERTKMKKEEAPSPKETADVQLQENLAEKEGKLPL